MRIPVIRGRIDRRVLVNYRVDPDRLARLLPSPLRPKLVSGWGMAGICLIRLHQIRPRFVPIRFGIRSENAAHRIAVEWDTPEGTRGGVYIPRRDTSLRLNAWAGGRLFPGEHHLACFDVAEQDGNYRIAVRSRDGTTRITIEGHVSENLPAASVFDSLESCSKFFESGSLGFSPVRDGARLDGLELRSLSWEVEPLALEHVESSFFDDRTRFPAGSAAFDSALLMRNIEHEWHPRPSLVVESPCECIAASR